MHYSLLVCPALINQINNNLLPKALKVATKVLQHTTLKSKTWCKKYGGVNNWKRVEVLPVGIVIVSSLKLVCRYERTNPRLLCLSIIHQLTTQPNPNRDLVAQCNSVGNILNCTSLLFGSNAFSISARTSIIPRAFWISVKLEKQTLIKIRNASSPTKA